MTPTPSADAVAGIARRKLRVRFAGCPIGLFYCGDTLCLKTGYATKRADGGYQADAYIVGNGEYFWGGASTSDERDRLIVTPAHLTGAKP